MMPATFLDRISDDLLKVDCSRWVLVLPSRRAITFYKRHVADKIEKPVMLPRVITMEELLADIIEREPVDPIRAGLELYQAYLDVYEEKVEYELFESWSSAILRDFNTIDTYLIEANTLYRDLRLIKEINEWSYLREELGAEQEEFNAFWQGLAKLYHRYRERLELVGLSYSGAGARDAAMRVGEGKSLAGVERIILAGFNALTAAECRMLDVWHEEGRLELYWDCSSYYIDAWDDPAGHFLRKWKNKAWKQHFVESEIKGRKMEVSAHMHTISQAKWAGGLLESYQSQLEETAVILADESMLPAVLDNIPDAVQDVNITIGLPFRQTDVYRYMAQWFKLRIQAERAQARTGTWKFHHDQLLDCLSSGEQLGANTHEDSLALKVRLFENSWVFLGKAELQELKGNHPVLKSFMPCEQQDLLPELIQLLGGIESEEPLNLGVIERSIELLEVLQATISQYTFVNTAQSIWTTVQGALSRERLSFIGEPLRGLQVMGLLEMRALHFDRLIMLGANEGSLPKAKRSDSFIPFELRRHHGLPTQMEEDAIFAYYFYRAISSTREVYIAYNSERDEFGGGEKSRYLSQIQAGLPQHHGLEIEVKAYPIDLGVPQLPEPNIRIAKSELVQGKVLQYFQKGISFSRLSEYLNCPLDFYYRSILGLKEEVEMEEALGANELGDLVHEILERSYKPHIGRERLSRADIQKMKVQIGPMIEGLIEEKGLQHRVEKGISMLTIEMARKMLTKFYEREEKRIESQSLSILDLEEDYVLELTTELRGQTVPLRFIAKMDRVEMEAGRLQLIDYKTGKVDASKLKLSQMDEVLFKPDRSKAFQLMYYTWFYYRKTGKIARSGIISMLGNEVEPKGLLIGKEKRREPNADEIECFEEMLFQLLENILWEGDFSHDQSQGLYCSHCHELAERSW